MPQVPYQPYPNVSPQAPGERISVATPGAAFGENVGAVLSHLGSSVDQVGGELFNRALALQQLNNENEARDLQLAYAKQSAQHVAEFDALEGKAKVDALGPHLDRLQALRDSVAGTSSNPMVRRMFLNDSSPFIQREIFSAAKGAGEANKKYTADNLGASYKLNLDDIRKFPDDDANFQSKIEKNKAIADQLSTLKGEPLDAPTVQLRLKQADSHAWASKIQGINETDPDRAAKVLEDHRADLTDEDYKSVEVSVKSQSRSISSTNIANETEAWGQGNEANGIPARTIGEKVEHAKELAKARHPDDPIVAQHAVTTLHGLSNTQNWEELQQRRQDSATVEGAIGDNNIQNIQQLKALPGMSDTIKRMGPKYENDLPNRINNINKTRRQETNQANYIRLDGLLHNDTEEFLNTDLASQGLAWPDYKYFQAKQNALKENPQKDLRVQRAVAYMQGSHASELTALGLDKRTEANKDDYDRYTGLLSQALDSWQQDHKKPASPQEIRDIIGPQIIRMEHVPGTFGYSKWLPAVLGGGSDQPFYRQDLTTPEAKDQMEKYRVEVQAKTGFEPTKEQLERAYTAKKYIELYGKKKTSAGEE